MSKIIKLKPKNIKRGEVRIEGTVPLLMRRVSEKDTKKLEQRIVKDGEGYRTEKGERVDPMEQVRAALYRMEGGGYGVPVRCFRKMMEDTADWKVTGISRPMVNKSVFFDFDGLDVEDGSALIALDAPEPVVHSQLVSVPPGSGKRVMRFRPMFEKWALNLRFEYNADFMSAETIVNMIDSAGWGNGLGEWRPQKGGAGDYGRFAVVRSK